MKTIIRLPQSREWNPIAAATALLRRLRSRICFGALVAVSIAVHIAEAGGQQQPATNSPTLPARGGDYVEGELLVKFSGGPLKPQIATSPHTVMRATLLRSFPAIGWDHVRLPEGMTVGQGIKGFLALPGVLAAEPNY